jgi:hypothetical protein
MLQNSIRTVIPRVTFGKGDGFLVRFFDLLEIFGNEIVTNQYIYCRSSGIRYSARLLNLNAFSSIACTP